MQGDMGEDSNSAGPVPSSLWAEPSSRWVESNPKHASEFLTSVMENSSQTGRETGRRRGRQTGVSSPAALRCLFSGRAGGSEEE